VRAHPDWTVIDITNRAVEETASAILSYYTKRFGSLTI
jgi:regulator of PEP synthase PpsR (kinase-PPPase family)